MRNPQLHCTINFHFVILVRGVQSQSFTFTVSVSHACISWVYVLYILWMHFAVYVLHITASQSLHNTLSPSKIHTGSSCSWSCQCRPINFALSAPWCTGNIYSTQQNEASEQTPILCKLNSHN